MSSPSLSTRPSASSNQATSTSSSNSSVEEPLYQVKLLSALRSGDPALIHPFLTEIGKDKRKSTEQNLDTGAAALHLAVRCASVATVALLLSHRAISPNGVHPPGSGTTALHLASSLGRVDIVNLLLEQEGINDSLTDANGKTCIDVAKGRDVIRVIEDSRAFLNASYRSLLHSYIMSPLSTPLSSALLRLLESPRVRFVNLSYLDDDSGVSLLHEAARRKDLRLIELAVRSGADVFVRNRRGKMAYEGTGKDDRVRVFLRQFANHDSSLIQAPSSAQSPVLKGYLNKYTNVAKGYNTRWFILENGVLSYYRHQEDESVASRGSISMKTAILKISTTDRLRFEVHSTPSRGHQSGVQKWYMKANHPVEASRWTQSISKSIEWHKHDNEGRRSGESDANGIIPKSVTVSSLHSHSHSRNESTKQGNWSEGESQSVASSHRGRYHSQTNDRGDEELDNDESSASESITKTVPFDSSFELHGNSTSAQMELTSQLLSNLVLPSDVSQQTNDLRSALKESFSMVQGMLDEYIQMVKVREEWFRKQLQKERDKSTLWEESFATVVKEGENLEKELRIRSRRRGSRFFDAAEVPGTVKQRQSFLAPYPPVIEESPKPASELSQLFLQHKETVEISRPTDLPLRSESDGSAVPAVTTEAESALDTDDEDEFFDAIEPYNIPNLIIPESLASPTHSELSLPVDLTAPYAGYRNLRTSLNLMDERPNTSLWSVLKHSIGKDLTRISFPVFFNEPTSMLQRMAEDMEFSECLDTAAREQDPLLRIAYVAAFAMSNYSSTIGRIAKPFNPMLSETFEYVRFDKEYRYISEQVSHHPPISACYSESPYWHYYGEVDAQNKFMGKSFEIRPTGVAHAELALPSELGIGYPKARGETQAGKVLEHYSWKKVTTNVSGFILGSPTIDHYGEMNVINHRTNDRCILTFKPRGWRGRDAYEISGHVIDSKGITRYSIAGRWNENLLAWKAGGTRVLQPDGSVGGPNSPAASREHILLWRNSEKPAGSPFNLTPFAISLNDCPEDTLKPFLCPTDCRLRVDQRAFELGKYELANQLKSDQEDRQRATRKARDEGKLPPHQPRWFTATTDGDTGERVWAPSMLGDNLEYWAQRERVWKEKHNGGEGQWHNVESIFIEEPDFL
ncbi:Oxysterol-binding protein-domain-containing protein [Desarmillaria tabescens]|uniref:Oxysterol-binding protein-domain-containing protein n=1 Tax=Armillaria tabescens TaxID=1929756 RepID=A0AA39N8S9_ARMTA|nr:Oxysterol-binding protein-domain-containing protein [Desarmillaria tabescens]KAK0461135.1 Oxysterol-binding protein-domain-containing protein [Desarmillaria tabescens]